MQKKLVMLAAAAMAGSLGVSAANASVSYSYTTYVTPSGVNSAPTTSYTDSVSQGR